MRKSLLTILIVSMFAIIGAAQTVTFVNAGTQKPANTNLDASTMGSVATIYISSPIMTNENVTYGLNGTTVTSGGFRISLDDCTGSHTNGTGVPKDLPLLGVYTVGSGAGAYNQVNFYIPNAANSEPFGTCNAGFKSLTLHPASGYNSGIDKNLTRTLPDADKPGVYGLAGLQHYNVVTGFFTAMSTCNSTPSACPVSTSGQLNYIIAYGTGGENAGSNGLAARLYYGGGGSWYSPTISAHASTGPGADQTNIQLVSGAVGTFDFTLGTAGAWGSSYESAWYNKISISIGAAN